SNWDKENATDIANTTVSGNRSDYINKRVAQRISLVSTNHTHGKGRYELIKNIKGRDTRINIMSTLSTSEQESQNSYNTDYDYSNNQSHHIRQENQNIDKKSAVLTFSANLGLKSLAYIREKSKNRTILDRLK